MNWSGEFTQDDLIDLGALYGLRGDDLEEVARAISQRPAWMPVLRGIASVSEEALGARRGKSVRVVADEDGRAKLLVEIFVDLDVDAMLDAEDRLLDALAEQRVAGSSSGVIVGVRRV